MTLVRVNHDMCDKVASLLATLSIPKDEEDTSVAGFTADETADFYLFLVAICHQTQTLKGHIDGKPLRGWEYLSPKLERRCRTEREFLSFEHWANITPSLVADVFRDDIEGCTLSDPDGRADLIRDLGTKMMEGGLRTFNEVHVATDGFLKDRSPCILELLSRFRAYNDPVRKKSYFLLGLMRNSGTWKFQDPHNLGPPVDYHEVRGHLRLNTVIVDDPSLHQKLLEGASVTESEDVEIRQAVLEAIIRISHQNSLPDPMTLHYLFWYAFRQICKRDSPYCNAVPDKTSVGLPARYEHLLEVLGGVPRCPFSGLCPSINLDRRYLEHRFDTHWY